MMTRFILLVLVLGALAGAFYGGRKYKGPVPFLDPGEPIAEASPAPSVATGPAAGSADESLLRFEHARLEVDKEPNEWLADELKSELTRQGIQNPLESPEPRFLYLYGRASLLAGKPDEAVRAFEAAIAKADLNPSPANATLRKEATFGLTAVALTSDKDKPVARARLDELLRMHQLPTPSSAPQSAPLPSPVSSP